MCRTTLADNQTAGQMSRAALEVDVGGGTALDFEDEAWATLEAQEAKSLETQEAGSQETQEAGSQVVLHSLSGHRQEQAAE